MRPLTVSHACVATCLGAGLPATLRALSESRSGLSPCRFETATIPTYVGEIAGLDSRPIDGGLEFFDCRNNRLARHALEQDNFLAAVTAARERYGANRIGLFLGTSTAGILETEIAYRNRSSTDGALTVDLRYAGTQNVFSVAAYVSRFLNITGPSSVASAACASSAKVFGTAARMIAAGLCDAAIVGGADSLCLTTLYGFRSLELTSTEPCRPFGADRDGISIGEAAGFALLERSGKAEAGAIRLLGVGESSDAHHMSSPHPAGAGAKLAMERALAAANLAPTAIGYVNLHGTATPAGDASEDRAVSSLFGTTIPCSSTKSHTGHTLGSAGIIEAIISMLALEHGLLPGSPLTGAKDPALYSDYLTENRRARVDRVLSNSFGFGGSNCSLVFGVA